MVHAMRRALVAMLVTLSTVGASGLAAGADPNGPDRPHLSFDFSDNGAPPSASGANFHIIVDVLPERTPGLVRVVATAPQGAGVSNLVCGFQPVFRSRVECSFNFSAGGTWSIRAQYATTTTSGVTAVTDTNIRVGY